MSAVITVMMVNTPTTRLNPLIIGQIGNSQNEF